MSREASGLKPGGVTERCALTPPGAPSRNCSRWLWCTGALVDAQGFAAPARHPSVVPRDPVIKGADTFIANRRDISRTVRFDDTTARETCHHLTCPAHASGSLRPPVTVSRSPDSPVAGRGPVGSARETSATPAAAMNARCGDGSTPHCRELTCAGDSFSRSTRGLENQWIAACFAPSLGRAEALLEHCCWNTVAGILLLEHCARAGESAGMTAFSCENVKRCADHLFAWRIMPNPGLARRFAEFGKYPSTQLDPGVEAAWNGLHH